MFLESGGGELDDRASSDDDDNDDQDVSSKIINYLKLFENYAHLLSSQSKNLLHIAMMIRKRVAMQPRRKKINWKMLEKVLFKYKRMKLIKDLEKCLVKEEEISRKLHNDLSENNLHELEKERQCIN